MFIINDWFICYLSLNVNKTSCVLFGHKSMPDIIVILMFLLTTKK